MEIVLTLLTQIAGLTSQASVVEKIIATLVELVPVVIKEYNALAPMVKGVISALSANPAATADQLATLRQVDAQADAEFDAALAKAEAEDAAADAKP